MKKIEDIKSKDKIDQIRDWLYDHHALPKSALGKAIAYTEKLWTGLTVFLEDAHVPLDNNLSERSLRGPVLGRKNYYGNHSLRGAQTSSMLYSICESCKLNNISPYTYMQYAVKMLLGGFRAFTPAKYAAEYRNLSD